MGKPRCPLCGGTKTVPVEGITPDLPCAMCGDDGEEPSPRCETCGGTGLIRTDCGPGRHHMDNDCPDCGSGEES